VTVAAAAPRGPALAAAYARAPEIDTSAARGPSTATWPASRSGRAELFPGRSPLLLETHVEWPSPTLSTCRRLDRRHVPSRVFTYVPYLVLSSITKRSGKSLVLEISRSSLERPPTRWRNPSRPRFTAGSMRTRPPSSDEVEGLGIAELRPARRALLAVLKRGLQGECRVPPDERSGSGTSGLPYRAFGFKAFAGVKDLAETSGRSLAIRLIRKPHDRKTGRFNTRVQGAELRRLRDDLHVGPSTRRR